MNSSQRAPETSAAARNLFPSALTAACVVVAALSFGKPVLAPLAVALLLSVILLPVVRRLESIGRGRFRLGRVGAVVIVAISISTVLAALGAVVVYPAREVADNLPAYRQTIHAKIEAPFERFEQVVRQVSDIATPPTDEPAATIEVVEQESPVGRLRDWTSTAFGALISAGVVIVLLVFLLIESSDFHDRLLRLAGRGNLRLTSSTLREAGDRVTRYLGAVVLLNCGHGLVVGIGLTLLDLPGGYLFGLLTAVLRFIPYVGPWTAGLAPVALALTVFEGWVPALEVAVFLALVELVSNNLVEPWLYGSRVGLSPLAVIVSTVFWTWIWGPVGLVLATPLTVCMVVLGRHIPRLRVLSIMLGDSRALQSFERMYERISAGDPGAAVEIFTQKSSSDGSLPALDSVAIPALHLLERDRRAGLLDQEDLATAREVFTRIADQADEPRGDLDGSSLPVLCVPASAGSDEIIAGVLAVELGHRGIVARACAHRLTSELVHEVMSTTVPIVCISALDPESPSLRHLLKRLQEGRAGAFFAVGCWGEPKERLEALRAELALDLEVEFVASLGEAADLLAARSRLKDAAAPAAADTPSLAIHTLPSTAG